MCFSPSCPGLEVGQHYLADRIHPSKYFVGGTVVGLKLHDPEVMGLSPAGCLAFYPRFLSLIFSASLSKAIIIIYYFSFICTKCLTFLRPELAKKSKYFAIFSSQKKWKNRIWWTNNKSFVTFWETLQRRRRKKSVT